MDKLAVKRPKPIIGDATNPKGLYRQTMNYLEALRVDGYSENTVDAREESLRRFIRWADEREVKTPQQIDIHLIEQYKKYLFYYRKKNQKPISAGSQRNLLGAVKGFLRYLAKRQEILFNPMAEIDFPRERQTLPKDILSIDEVNHLLRQPDLNTPFGIRDRAIMETMYSTGIRRLECVSLTLGDVDVNRETLFINQGKGGKDRVVPLGQRALKWIESYLDNVRPRHLFKSETDALFLTQYGKPLTASFLSDQVSRHGMAK